MIAFLTVLFAALLMIGGVGTAVCVLVYRSSDWRSSAVGRHLMFYMCALCFLYALSVVSFFVHALWLAAPMIIGHVIFDTLIWQRAWIIWRAQHRRD